MKKIKIIGVLTFLTIWGACTIPTSYVHTYKDVKYSELDNYLEKISDNRIYYIDVKEITAEDLKGNIETLKASPLGEKIKKSNKLVGIKIPSKIENLTSMEACFYGCENLIDIGNIPKGVNDLSYCFYKCTLLKELPNMPKSIENMNYCFSGCAKLIKGQMIPENVSSLKACFQDCYSLKSVKLKCSIPEEAKNYRYMFENCNSLEKKSIKVKSADLSKYKEEETIDSMFALNPGNSSYSDQQNMIKEYFH